MFFALMAVLAVTTVSAQDNGQQDERKRGREGRVEMMTKELNLTEAQKTQMTALMDDTQKKLEALEQQKKEIFESQKARMEQILTEEQLAKFKEMGSRHHGPRHGDFKDKGEFRGRGHRGHGPRHHGKPAGEGCDKCKDCPQEGEAQAK